MKEVIVHTSTKKVSFSLTLFLDFETTLLRILILLWIDIFLNIVMLKVNRTHVAH